MPDADEIDISTLSFDAWLRHFFEMPMRESYCFGAWDLSDPRRHLEHFTRFCEESRAILWLYKADAARIEFVFWTLTHGTADLLWHDRVQPNYYTIPSVAPNHALRMQVIEAARIPYQDVYRFIADAFVGSAFYMWWHTWLDGFRAAYGRPPIKGDYEVESDEERAERDAIFDTLKHILEIDQIDCQLAACHGLNHLSHPDRYDLLDGFIRRKADAVDAETLRFLYACRDSEAM